MPLIKPEVQKVLRKAGLKEPESEKLSVNENLDIAGLSNEAIAEELTRLALNSNNEALKLRALETALKVRGALKEAETALPQFTIIIQNSDNSTVEHHGINPIVFPRQSLKNMPACYTETSEAGSESDSESDDEEIIQ